MADKITLVYQTDNWHTHSSRVLIAVCDSKQKAIDTIDQYVFDKYKACLTEHDEELLNSIGQTQGDASDNPFEGEFIIEEVTINKIL